ncbi:MAG: diaminopimelate epimerase, partial [Ilumatobacteraceae bacterium]
MNNPSAYTLSKHHALGNDFLVLDKGQAHIDTDATWPEFARLWCDRRIGIGADGLLLLEIRDRLHLTMELFNADGSPAEMSGNGIRCLVQAAVQALAARGERGTSGFDVQTAAGTRRVDVVEYDTRSDAQTMMLRVDMGVVTEIDPPANWSELGCHEDRPVRHLSLGNPHAVVGVDDVQAVDLRTLGEKVPTVNLEIVEPGPETNGVTMRVHERGAGLTMACGTGACAAAAAALTWG